MLDSGATHNYVSADTLCQLGIVPTYQTSSLLNVRLADGSILQSSGNVTLNVQFAEGLSCQLQFVVLKSLLSQMLLGQPFLQQYNPSVDWTLCTLVFNLPDVSQTFQVAGFPSRDDTDLEVWTISAKDGLKMLEAPAAEVHSVGVLFVQGKQGLAGKPQEELLSPGDQLSSVPVAFRSVLKKHAAVFDPPGPPVARSTQHRIELVDPSQRPCKRRMYRLTPSEREAVDREIARLFENGWIEHSHSPYAAPILLIRKKTGDLRIVIDYRLLNSNTILDKFPLPRIDDLVDQLGGATIFSKVDLTNAYHQIPMHVDDKPKTAFITPSGLYQWKVLPLGLCNAPATFQRLMSQVFGPELGNFVLVYLDDVLVFSRHLEEHVAHLDWVFSRLQQFQLHAKLSKCDFGLQEVEYLGHIIGQGSIHADPSKVAAIREWPQPTTVKQVQQFLGLANYYHRFIHRYAEISAPLTDLLKKKQWLWSLPQDLAFDRLKWALCHQPVLALPNFALPFEVHTDVSRVAIGASLMQDQGAGLQPIQYFSRKLSGAESRYEVHDRELLALLDSLHKFRPYVYGRHTLCFTDHKPLEFFHSQGKLSDRQARWLNRLQQYSLTFRYKPGKQHIVPDCLSRRPDYIAEDTTLADKRLVTLPEVSDADLAAKCTFATREISAVRTWLQVAAPDVTLETCIEMGIANLQHGNLLVSRNCGACGATLLSTAPMTKNVTLEDVQPKSKNVTTTRIGSNVVTKCRHCSWKCEDLPGLAYNPLALLDLKFEDNTLKWNLPTLPLASFSRDTLDDNKSTPLQHQHLGSAGDNSVATITVEPSWLERLASAQRDAPELARFRDFARASHSGFEWRQLGDAQLLYRTVGKVVQLVLPEAGGFRDLLLQESHSSKMAGHFGVTKTMKLLTKRVWWPSMLLQVRKFISSCEICQKYKTGNTKPAGLLQPIEAPSTKFSSWSMDFISNLPTVIQGERVYNSIYTCVDRFSKFVVLIPVQLGDNQLTAQEVASLFYHHVICKFGLPQSILHDRDPRFTSHFWEALWKLTGTSILMSSSYHPQTDGLTERVHRTVEQLLRVQLAGSDQSDWLKLLPLVQFVLNSAVQESTRFSPFKIVYGCEPRLPMDFLDGIAQNPAAEEFWRDSNQLLTQVRENLTLAQQAQKKVYDRHHSDLAFDVGDQVLLSTQHCNLAGHKKFNAKYIGPFTVQSRIGLVAYQLTLPPSLRLHNVIHVSQLKRFTPPTYPLPNRPQPVFIDGEERYQVERILAHRTWHGHLEFLVRWKGYTADEDTWESKENLEEGARDILNKYMKRQYL